MLRVRSFEYKSRADSTQTIKPDRGPIWNSFFATSLNHEAHTFTYIFMKYFSKGYFNGAPKLLRIHMLYYPHELT